MNDLKKIIESKFGKGSAFRLSDDKKKVKADPTDFIPSGSLNINYHISGNRKCGYPLGRIIEIFGQESSGKTTLALHACSEVVKSGNECLFVDAEHALDMRYVKKIISNHDLFTYCQPSCAEDSFEVIEESIRENKNLKLVVVDSVAGMVPRAELEGSMDDQSMGLAARVMGKGLRKLKALASQNNCVVIFINQIRSKIGGYGSPTTTPGGNALKFWATIRLEIFSPRSGKIIESVGPSKNGRIDDEIDEELINVKKGSAVETGKIINIKSIKNKIYPPFKEFSLKIIYGRGIDKEEDLLMFLKSIGIIDIQGKKITYRGKKFLKSKFLVLAKTKLKDKIKSDLRDKE